MKQKNLLLLVGLPASGKSSWGRNYTNDSVEYVSRDEIRFSLMTDNDDYFAHEKQVYKTFINKIQAGLDNPEKETVIADATHLNVASRMKLIHRLNLSGDVKIIPVFFNTKFDTCCKRNNLREGVAKVPSSVIRRMSYSLTDPATDDFDYTEIWYINEGDV